jgi:hypothetical protein
MLRILLDISGRCNKDGACLLNANGIAERLGVSRVHFYRVLKDMQKLSLLSLYGNGAVAVNGALFRRQWFQECLFYQEMGGANYERNTDSEKPKQSVSARTGKSIGKGVETI